MSCIGTSASNVYTTEINLKAESLRFTKELNKQAAVYLKTRLNAANRKLVALGACVCVYACFPEGNPYENNNTHTQALVGPLFLATALKKQTCSNQLAASANQYTADVLEGK